MGKQEYAGIKKGHKLRILLVLDNLGHSTGYYVVARGLRQEGFEIVLGGYQVPREIVEVAIQESVDCIGYRIMDGAPDILIEDLFSHMQNKGIEDLPVIVGGIIPKELDETLKNFGVKGIFTPGSKIEDIAHFIREIAAK